MKHLMLLAAGAAALGLAACDRADRAETKTGKDAAGTLRTIARLDCPESQGKLKRVSAAADGKTCVYAGQDSEVTLSLMALDGGDARAVLTPIETGLQALMPERAKGAGEAGKTGDMVNIDMPGLHIKADDGGANIRVGDIKIDADESGNAEVRVGDETDGGVLLNANDEGAEIRHQGKGEGVRSTYILASEKAAASGYHLVGYEARGPQAGPLAVAVVKARDDHRDRGVFDDMKDLVERNVGE